MADTLGYSRNDKYRKDYLEALEPWKKSREECVEVAKYRSTMPYPTLPRYFQIKNRILIVLAEPDWAVAERYRLECERIYAEALYLTKQSELAELQVLSTFRIELDKLKDTHGEDPRLGADITGELTRLEIGEENAAGANMVGEEETESEAVEHEMVAENVNPSDGSTNEPLQGGKLVGC